LLKVDVLRLAEARQDFLVISICWRFGEKLSQKKVVKVKKVETIEFAFL